MRFSLDRIDIEACQAAGHAPATVIARERPGDAWVVAAGPLVGPRAEHGVVWAHSTSDHVMVPVFAYETAGRDPADALTFALQLGALALVGYARRPARVHIAYGHVLEDLSSSGRDAFRYHLGIAIQF
jgi:hypothetical protein